MTLWIVTVASVSYFAHHAVHGNRGLAASRAHEIEIAELNKRLDELRRQRGAIERRVDALTPPAIDRDLLDEMARERLGYLHPHERVLLER